MDGAKSPPTTMHRKGNLGPERRLREIGAQWSEVTDPLTHTCAHGMSQKEGATAKLPLPFLVASFQNTHTKKKPLLGPHPLPASLEGALSSWQGK